MPGARSAKRIGLCFFLLYIVALRTATSHQLTEAGEHEVEQKSAHAGKLAEEHEGGAGEYGKELEKDEKEDKLSAYSMGLTMLGMLVLLTFLYHLTHAKRMETREISWKMFSGTISIFVGVLVYTSLNQCFNLYVVHGWFNIDQENDRTWFIAINRYWVAFFYLLFVMFISKKAYIGKGVKARLETLEESTLIQERNLHSIFDDRRCVSESQVSSDGLYHAVKRHVHLLGSLEVPHREITAGKPRFKDAVCGMKCSLFWAHAIGFAGIDGWNAAQQKDCGGQPQGMMIWRSVLLFARAVLQYYVILRVLAILWRYLMKKLIEPKCWFIIRHRDHHSCEVLTEGRHTSEEEKVWMDFKNDAEEDSDDEGWEAEKQKPQEFELEWCLGDDGSYQFKLKYKEFIADARRMVPTPKAGSQASSGARCPRAPQGEMTRYYVRKIKSTEHQNMPVFQHVDQFDPKSVPWLPLWIQYQYKVGDDCYAVPEYDELVKEWDDIRKDGENDCYALMLSFIVVQTLQLIVSGVLPNKDEDVKLLPSSKGGGHQRSEYIIVYVFAASLLVFAWKLYAALVRLRRNPMFFRVNEEGIFGKCEKVAYDVLACIHKLEPQIMRDELHNTIERILDILVTVLCMSASWSITYATKWLLAQWTAVTREDTSVIDVVLAITVTFTVFLLLYFADVFIACRLSLNPLVARDKSGSTCTAAKQQLLTAQYQRGKQMMEKAKMISRSHKGAFRKVNTSVGLLIGFTWEVNFDKAVENIADTLSHEDKRAKVAINFACMLLFVLLIYPIWKFQILPMSEEQGYKFGFIPRNMCVRMMMIHDDFKEAERVHHDPDAEADQDKLERGKNHVKHMKENAHELRIMQEFLKRWQEHPMMADTPKRSRTEPTMDSHRQ